ncbi:hypothetical protein GJ496_001232 [Pomphorhynchus laevis]|nr:hypothetical protein GJ496_001232 [Pomphorhynchus laevis]
MSKLKFISIVFIDIGSFVGNCLVILVITSTRNLNLPQNYLLISLTCVDLLLSLISMPIYIMTSILNERWILGFQACRLFMICDVVLSCASILNLCAISIDRYIALFYPIRYKFNRNKHLMALFLGSCFLSMLISTPLLFLKRYDIYKHLEKDVYVCIMPFNKPFISLVLIFGYYLPVTILIYTNCCICLKLHTSLIQSSKKLSVFNGDLSDAVKMMSINGYSSRLISKDIILSLTICSTVMATILCWTPFYLILSISMIMTNSDLEMIKEKSMWLGYLNSVINPIIYNFINSDFQRRVLNILKTRRNTNPSS